MIQNEDFESIMSFWTAFEDLATVSEDMGGEEIEEMTPGIKRLNSEDNYLTRTRWRMRKDDLFLIGVEYEEEYFDSLFDNSWSKDQKCVFCKVQDLYLNFISMIFSTKILNFLKKFVPLKERTSAFRTLKWNFSLSL